MINWLVVPQAPFLRFVLAWAGVLKLAVRSTSVAARRSALRRLVGEGRVVLAFRTAGCAEIYIAAALFVRAGTVASVLAQVWCVALGGYLLYARLAAPRSSCGCLGKGTAPVRGRSFDRIGLMTAAAAVNLAFPHGSGFGDHVVGSIAVGAVGAVEMVLIVLLSPELDVHWLLPLRRWRTARRHPLARASRQVPIGASARLLVNSDAYRSVGGRLRSDLLDTWDEGEWRLMTYALTTGKRRGIAVFAVPLRGHHPGDVRVAVVDDAEQLFDVPAIR